MVYIILHISLVFKVFKLVSSLNHIYMCVCICFFFLWDYRYDTIDQKKNRKKKNSYIIYLIIFYTFHIHSISYLFIFVLFNWTTSIVVNRANFCIEIGSSLRLELIFLSQRKIDGGEFISVGWSYLTRWFRLGSKRTNIQQQKNMKMPSN